MTIRLSRYMAPEQSRIKIPQLRKIFWSCSRSWAPYLKLTTGATPMENPRYIALNTNWKYMTMVMDATPSSPQ